MVNQQMSRNERTDLLKEELKTGVLREYLKPVISLSLVVLLPESKSLSPRHIQFSIQDECK